jgi:transglutaminase-like putative cysteine protease
MTNKADNKVFAKGRSGSRGIAAGVPRASLFWMLMLMVLLVLPHLTRMPLWLITLSIICVCWRWLIFKGRAEYPGRWLRSAALMVVAGATLWQYRDVGINVDATVTLLISGCMLKLLEMQYRRDIYIVNALSFLLLMTGFIYSQSMLAGAYNLLVAMLVLASMISLNRLSSTASVRSVQTRNLKMAGVIILQAIPLMLVLFVMVPRIAPLMAVTLPATGSTTGVSDEMTPGDISALARSDEIAFRVKFETANPAPNELYWRGVVLDEFDGNTWSRNDLFLRPRVDRELQAVVEQPRTLDYNIIMQPTQQNWLYGINVAQVTSPGVFLDSYNSLVSSRPVAQRLRYDVRSHLDAITDIELGSRSRARATQLPDEGNPRARELAQQLRQQYPDDKALTNAILTRFREQEYFYTLYPPLMQNDGIDAFLFDQMQGFCEHYAGAMTFLLRAAEIPARVVVGYQGAEHNRFDDYLIVYQYNAHAWIEVWYEGEGWQRVDPTFAVAPERIDVGAEMLLRQTSENAQDTSFASLMMRDNAFLNTLRLRLDSIEYSWHRWVVSYDEATQLELLSNLLGQEGLRWLPYILVLLLLSILGTIAGVQYLRNRVSYDPLVGLCLMFCGRLENTSLVRDPGEAPKTYFKRLSTQCPQQRVELDACATELNAMLYENSNKQQHKAKIRQLAARLKLLARKLRQHDKSTRVPKQLVS